MRRVNSKSFDLWIFLFEPINHFLSRPFGRCVAYDKESEVVMGIRAKEDLCRLVALSFAKMLSGNATREFEA